ncbi:MAG TPA: thiamine phosphate synthase [Candidatus Acidoferrales bacterium]
MKLAFPPLYAIMDAVFAPSLRTSELSIAEMLAEARVELIQYRNKQSSPRHLLEISRQWIPALRVHGARFVVNDRADVAAVSGAEVVHVGQEDLPVEAVRRMCGPKMLIGVSTHTLEQVRAADATSADYIAIGPLFATTTKEKADPVIGVEGVQMARAATRKPLVAIGGITLGSAAEVYRAGADCIAVSRDLLTAEDPAARAQHFLEIATQVLSERE